MVTTKTSGLGDNFYIGGYDLSGDLSAFDRINGGPALLDATTIKQLAHARLAGQRTGGISFSSLFENTPTISTPGFPASNTPVTNTNNVPVLVTITGGTLTNVLVNGSSVGTTAGTYNVPVNGTIAVVYTVAPTWNWFALGTLHNALKAPITLNDLEAMYCRGTALGNPAACMNSKQTNYDPSRDQQGNLILKVELVSNGFGLEWGTLLTAGLRTDTTPTTGAFIDQGAGTNFGAQAYLQIIDLVGTNVDVTITHATTSGGAYTTLMDFGSQTGIGGFRQSVANNVTVNEFIKVVTAGTFTYVTFAVVMNRNLIAGQVF